MIALLSFLLQGFHQSRRWSQLTPSRRRSRLVPDDKGTAIPLKADGSRHTDWDWPQSKTWKQMEDLVAKGKVKAIGVSNCGIPILEGLKKEWKIVPAVNQVSGPRVKPSTHLKRCGERRFNRE